MARAPKPTVDRASYRAGYQAGIAAKRRHPDAGPGVADLYFAHCMSGLLAGGHEAVNATVEHAAHLAAVMLTQRTSR